MPITRANETNGVFLSLRQDRSGLFSFKSRPHRTATAIDAGLTDVDIQLPLDLTVRIDPDNVVPPFREASVSPDLCHKTVTTGT